MDLRLLRRIVAVLLEDLLGFEHAELGILIVGTPEIIRLNESFLHHAGATDVIAFDYSTAASLSRPSIERPGALHGEICVCFDEAVAQAHRFRTSWQAEVVRYIIHGVLHLQGFDDRRSADRRRMKIAEDRLVRRLAVRFPLSRLACKTKLRS